MMLWIGVLFAMMACQSESTSEDVKSASAGATSQSITLAFQGQGSGEIAPCGCPKNPMGGLTRRNLVIEELKTEGPVVVLESGNSLLPSGVDPNEAEQRKVKMDLIAASYQAVGLDAMAIGAQDWQLGIDALQQVIEKHELPVVAANITCEGMSSLRGHRVIERSGWRVGVIGIAAGSPEGCVEKELRTAVLAELEVMPPVDVRVMLWAEDVAQYSRYAEDFTDIDLVVGGRGGAPRPHPVRNHASWWVLPHMQSKQLSLLELSKSKGAKGWAPEGYREVIEREVGRFQSRLETLNEQLANSDEENRAAKEGQVDYVTKRLAEATEDLNAWDKIGPNRNTFRYSHRTLDKGLPEHPGTKSLYDAALQQIAKQEKEAGLRPRKRLIEQESSFAGAHSCVPCHRPQHLQWSTTAHARAYQSLIDENRHMDQECYRCHVTGAGHPEGPQRPADVGAFQDVQCEVCHGPSREHTLDPTAIKPIKVPTQESCVVCHDGVRDEGRFDWLTYLPKVSHPSP